jgi:putative ABC transport system substrate-binding protein
MKRREFLLGLAGAAALPASANAQQQPVIGFLNSQSPEGFVPYVEAYRQGLAELGYMEGHNIATEYRWARGRPELLQPMAADLVARRVSVLVTTGGETVAVEAKKATTAIPHIFLIGGDPIRVGLVNAYNRPGGNSTGANLLTTSLEPKRLGLLRALLPEGRQITFLMNPNGPAGEPRKDDVIAAARATNHEIIVLSARDPGEIDQAFKELEGRRTDALLVSGDPFFNSRREQIVALANHIAMPAIYEWREFAAAGGLMSYGTVITEQFRNVGRYTGRVLKGEKPADMPVLQPSKFELVINLKTAKAIGLKVPDTLLAQADDVIE